MVEDDWLLVTVVTLDDDVVDATSLSCDDIADAGGGLSPLFPVASSLTLSPLGSLLLVLGGSAGLAIRYSFVFKASNNLLTKGLVSVES